MTAPLGAHPGSHLILFDGVCGLCQWTIRFVLAHDVAQLFDFAPLDSGTGRRFLGDAPGARGADTFYVVTDYRTPAPVVLGKGRAALYVTRRLGRPWRWLTVADLLPASVLDWLYDCVARHRYAVFGRYDTCPVPRPEHRARFVGGPGNEERLTPQACGRVGVSSNGLNR